MRYKRIWNMVAGVLGILAGGLTGTGATPAAEPEAAQKTGIILVAFGTSVPEAQEVFTHIMKSARARFPGHDIVYGFTARSIVQKLRDQKRDNGVLTLEEALAEMKQRGHVRVVLQSLHVSPGQKDAEIPAAVQKSGAGLKTAFGAPLLATDGDLQTALAALAGEIAKDGATVFCGHGNGKHPEYNAQMIALDKLLREKFPAATLWTVEGKPGNEALEAEIKPAVAKAGGKVTFVPLMIVAGDHILNDVNGAEQDSWKNRLGATNVTIAKPLGYNEAILNLFWQHLDDALKTVASEAGAAAK